MNKIAIMQPYFLPYIGYWQMLHAVDTFVLYDDVTYIKKGWINRNRILVNGEPWTFTVPLKNASQNVLIKDLVVADGIGVWCTRMLKTLERSYSNAPFYAEAMPLLQACFSSPSSYMTDWIEGSFEAIGSYLKTPFRMVRSSRIDYNRELKGQDKILELCRILRADMYINAIGGMSLYDAEAFTRQNITLKFIQAMPVEYEQMNATFVPWLSMIDVMMFNRTEVVREMLDRSTLL